MKRMKDEEPSHLSPDPPPKPPVVFILAIKICSHQFITVD